MTILTISSSLDANSRSEQIAHLRAQKLGDLGCDAPFLSLKDHVLPPFSNGPLEEEAVYRFLHEAVSRADGLVLASPVYNWGCCAELKKFVEFIGSTPPDGSVRGAFFDKVVTFVNAAGFPHSFTAFTGLANAMMFDFKCIINPFNVYIHNRHYEGDQLGAEALARIDKSMMVALQLSSLLQGRTYKSQWEL